MLRNIHRQLLGCCILMWIAGSGSAQTYQWAFNVGTSGIESATAVAFDAAGNVFVAGYYNGTVDFDPGVGTANLTSSAYEDMFIAKYNSSGAYIWAKSFGSTVDDEILDIAVDAAGNVYFGGFTYTSFTASAMRVTKLDPSGNIVWDFQVGNGYVGHIQCRGIAVDLAGNVYITGGMNNMAGPAFDLDPGGGMALTTHSGFYDIFVAKYNSSGAHIWSASLGATQDDRGHDIAVDPSGNVYVTGIRGVNNNATDIWIAKYNVVGVLQWQKQMGDGGTSFSQGYGIALDINSAEPVITGSFQTTVDFDPSAGTANLVSGGSEDIFFAKYDVNGNYIFAHKIGSTPGADVGRGIFIDAGNNINLCGDFSIGMPDFDPGVGTVSLTSGGSKDIFFARYTSAGNYTSAKNLGTTGCVGKSIAVDLSGNIYLGGDFAGAVDFNPDPAVANLTSNGSRDVFYAKYSGCITAPSQPGTITGSATVCQGSAQTYSISSVPGATSYTWTLPNGWTGTSTTNSISVTAGVNNGTISVVANNGCGNSTPRTLSVSTISIPLQPGSISGSAVVCPGSAQTYSVANNPAATSYTWTLPNGWTGSSTTNSISVTAGANGGTISVTANNSCGNSVAQNLSVSMGSAPGTPSGISGNATICPGSAQTYSVANDPNATSYTWTLPNGWSGSSITNSISVTAGNNSGTISVYATNSCGNSSPQTMSITVNNPSVSISSPDTVICIGQVTTLNASGANSYSWQPGNLSGNSVQVSPGNTTVYTLTGTDLIGCNAQATITVVINSLPPVSAGNDQAVCTGAPVTLSGSGAQNYTWNNGVNDGVLFTPVSTNNYIVTGTDANGCSNTDTVLVTVNSLPNVSAGNDQQACTGGSVTLSGSGAQNYTWNNGVNNSVPFTPVSTNTYIVTGTDANNCSNTDTVTVTINSLPNVNAGNDQSACAGTSVTLSGSGAQNYTWNNGVNNGIPFTPASTDSYIVTGTDANNCSNTDTVVITVNPLPNTDLNYSGTTFFCEGEAAQTLNGGSPAGGVYSGPGVTGNSFNPATAGTGIHYVTYTYTDNNGCSNADSVQFTVQSCLGENNISTGNISVYPNPGKEIVYLDMQDASNQEAVITLYSIEGKEISFLLYAGAANPVRYSTEGLAPGTYIFSIHTGGLIKTIKWIKE